MKRKILLIGLVVALILTAAVPAATLAKGGWHSPFERNAGRFSVMLIPNPDETGIDPTEIGTTWPERDVAGTNVWPIMDVVGDQTEPAPIGWIVDGRSIYGVADGDFAGPFTLTYGGVVDTMQSGAIQGVITIDTGDSTIYLAGEADLETEGLEYYSFAEIQLWCGLAGFPSVGPFFALMYYNSSLEVVPDVILETMYGDVLPPLPKSLIVEFSGSLKVEAATGIDSGISGQGKIRPVKNDPLILYVWPSQHVYALDGAMQLTGTYVKKQMRRLEVDKDKLSDWMDQWGEEWKDNRDGKWNEEWQNLWKND